MIKQLRAIACGALSIIVLATALIPLDTSYAYVSDKFDGYEEGREYNTSELYDIKFRTSKLGLYGMTIESHEIPSNEWLTFISHDYFPYTTLSDQTEVDNTAPSAVYSAQGIVKVDVVFATGELSQMDRLEGYTDTFTSILEQAGNNFDVQVTAVETVTGGFDMADADAATIYNFWDQYPNPNNYSLHGDRIVNAVYDWNGLPATSGRGSSKFNQLFIESGSYETTDFKLSSRYAWHGCLVPSGYIFRYNPNSGSCYVITFGTDTDGFDGARLFKVSNINSILGHNNGNTPWVCEIASPVASYSMHFAESGIGDLIELEVTGGNIKVYANSRLIIDYTDPNPYESGGVGLYAACTVAYSDVMLSYDTTITKSLGESIQDVAWRDGSVRFVVHATDIIPMECDPSNPTHEEDYAYTVAKLLNANCYLVNLGNNINKSQLDDLVAAIREADGTSKGTFYYNNNPNIETAMNNSANYIISIAKQFEKPVDWILVNTEILWNTIYSDSENDPPLNLGEHNGQNAQPQDTSDIALGQSYGLGNAGSTLQFDESKILAERWRYRHYNNFFDNSPVQVSWHEVWIEDPVSIFEYPGKYRINYKRRDNPLYPSVDLSDPFDSYRYWSTDYDYAT